MTRARLRASPITLLLVEYGRHLRQGARGRSHARLAGDCRSSLHRPGAGRLATSRAFLADSFEPARRALYPDPIRSDTSRREPVATSIGGLPGRCVPTRARRCWMSPAGETPSLRSHLASRVREDSCSRSAGVFACARPPRRGPRSPALREEELEHAAPEVPSFDEPVSPRSRCRLTGRASSGLGWSRGFIRRRHRGYPQIVPNLGIKHLAPCSTS